MACNLGVVFLVDDYDQTQQVILVPVRRGNTAKAKEQTGTWPVSWARIERVVPLSLNQPKRKRNRTTYEFQNAFHPPCSLHVRVERVILKDDRAILHGEFLLLWGRPKYTGDAVVIICFETHETALLV